MGCGSLPRTKVIVSDDAMAASILWIPDTSAPALSTTFLKELLRGAQVCQGIDQGQLEKLVGAAPQRPCRLVVARGTAAVAGRQAVYHWDLHTQQPGTLNSAGAMDFRERALIQNVQEGEVLAIIEEACEEAWGTDVFGRPVPPPPTDPAPTSSWFPAEGMRTRVLPDGRHAVVATQAGILVREADRLSVGPGISLPGDVDYETGNIGAQGSVHVHGTVRQGFQLTCHGDLLVEGTVEAARVFVARDMTVRGGLIGMTNEGKIRVGGDLSARFAQNARVRCQGSIVVEAHDTGSHLECRGTLGSLQQAAKLRGGEYVARKGLIAEELGSRAGVATRVRVGVDPDLERKLDRLQGAVTRTRQHGRKVNRQLRTHAPRKSLAGSGPSLTSTQPARRLVKQQRERWRSRQAVVRQKRRAEAHLFEQESVEVQVLGMVHPGVVIEIGGFRRPIREQCRGAVFFLDKKTGQLIRRDP